MKKIIIFTGVILFNFSSIFAYDIKVDTIIVINKEQIVYEYIITIQNTEEDPLWIWLDDEKDKNEKDKIRAIRKHFFRNRGDFSIYNIATDPNLEVHWWEEPTPIELFVKYLKANQFFTIVICEEMDDENTSNSSFSLDFLNIYSDHTLRKYDLYFDMPYSVERISYPYHIFIYESTPNPH